MKGLAKCSLEKYGKKLKANVDTESKEQTLEELENEDIEYDEEANESD